MKNSVSNDAAKSVEVDGPQVSRAERRRRLRDGLPEDEAPKTGLDKARATTRTTAFRIAAAFFAAGLLIVFFSQVLPHDYGFLELGWLFTLSIYDLVLAMLGLAVAVALSGSAWRARAIVIAFALVALPMMFFFDPIFVFIRESPLGEVLFLIAPTAVFSAGAVLWLPGRWRDYGALVAAAIVSFSYSLFLGLDDFGTAVPDFASGSFFCALWLIAAPGLLLRQFKGDWLKIPARIVGSWLVVISLIVTASLYVPDLQLGNGVDGPPDNGIVTPDGNSIIMSDPGSQ